MKINHYSILPEILAATVAAGLLGPAACSSHAEPAAATAPDKADLVAHYVFDGGSGNVVKNLAGPAADGKIFGPISWVRAGKFQGLAFDGANNYVECGKMPQLDESNGMTVLVWFNCTHPTGRRFLINAYNGDGWSMESWNGTFRSAPFGLADQPQVADGQWHLAALTVENGQVRDYLDGELVSSGDFGQKPILNVGADLAIGKLWGGEDLFGFHGTIAEVRIYNRVISEKEIAAIYNAVFPEPPANSLIVGARDRLLERLKLLGRLAPEVQAIGEMEKRVAAVDAAVKGKAAVAKQLSEVDGLNRKADTLQTEVAGVFYRAKLGAAQTPMLWSVDTLTKVFADGYLPAANAADVARADAMRGEQEPVQLVVASCDYQGPVTVGIEPLKHESGGVINTVDLKRVTEQKGSANTPIYFQTRKPLRAAPATFPDALEPNRPFEIKPHSARPIWATIQVPRDAKPGLYRGDFVVTSANGESRFPLELRVYEVTLPPKPKGSFGGWAGVAPQAQNKGFASLDNGNYDDPRFWELLEKALVSHREHRLNMFTDVPFWEMFKMVDVTRNAGGTYRFDYTKFDRFPALMDKVFGGDWRAVSVGLPLDSKIHDADGKPVAQFPKKWDFNDPAFAAYAKTSLDDLTRHLQEKGWLDKLYFTYRDEPYGETINEHIPVYAKLKKLAPKLQFMVTLVSSSFWAQMPTLDLGVHSWDSAKKDLTPVVQGTAAGRRGTLYNNYSAMLDLPLLPFRVTAPAIYHTGLEGYYHWAWWWANPTVNGDTFTPAFGPGEGLLVYQTDPLGEFIDSLRYEQLREISEDYDLYQMAEAAGINAKSYALRQSPGLLEFNESTADYFRVRRELLEALEKANRDK